MPQFACNRAHGHHRQHGGRFQLAVHEAQFIRSMDPIDEIPVPVGSRAEIVPEWPIDECENHVAIRQEQTEMEAFQQQGKNILCADALETRRRTVVIDELLASACFVRSLQREAWRKSDISLWKGR